MSKKIKTTTNSERDKNGFCDLYLDGEKTSVKILTFTPAQSDILLDAGDIDTKKKK